MHVCSKNKYLIVVVLHVRYHSGGWNCSYKQVWAAWHRSFNMFTCYLNGHSHLYHHNNYCLKCMTHNVLPFSFEILVKNNNLETKHMATRFNLSLYKYWLWAVTLRARGFAFNHFVCTCRIHWFIQFPVAWQLNLMMSSKKWWKNISGGMTHFHVSFVCKLEFTVLLSSSHTWPV